MFEFIDEEFMLTTEEIAELEELQYEIVEDEFDDEG